MGSVNEVKLIDIAGPGVWGVDSKPLTGAASRKEHG
jgi:hypothetical protein